MSQLQAIDRSFGEIAALAKRAARGAGYAWGACEDASMATEWLARHGFPSIEALSQALSMNRPWAAPSTGTLPWTAVAGTWLCPILTGAALADHLPLALYAGEITVAGLRSPLLAAGCVAAYGEAIGCLYQFNWNGIVIEGDKTESQPYDTTRDLLTSCAGIFKCTKIKTIPSNGLTLSLSRPRIELSHWRHLERLAARTYAPPSESSRLLGAGPSED